jgi:hypothetical protein
LTEILKVEKQETADALEELGMNSKVNPSMILENARQKNASHNNEKLTDQVVELRRLLSLEEE